MNLFICLVLAAVTATTTYGQAPDTRPTELLDGLKVLSDLLTDKKSQYIRYDGHEDY